MKPRPLPNYVEGEYAALDLPAGWHVVSLLCFLAALGSRLLVSLLLPYRWPTPSLHPLVPGAAVLLFSTLGLLCGLLGLRNARRRGMARIGIFLNATVLVFGLLATFAYFAILRR